MSEEEAVVEERRMVAIIVKPCEGVDPEELYKVRPDKIDQQHS